MSYETLIAVRNIAQKQVDDLNKLIKDLCKPIKIVTRNDTYIINTIYHTCYPAEFEAPTRCCNSALNTLLTNGKTYYRSLIDEPNKIGHLNDHTALLINARILYKATISDDEKKRLAKIIDMIVAKVPGLIKAYTNGTDYSDDEINSLYAIFNDVYRYELLDKVIKQIHFLEFAGNSGMDCKSIERELHKLIVEWSAKNDNMLLLGGYE